MTEFEILFGIKEAEIKDTCVLLPLVPPGLRKYPGLSKAGRGKLYSVFSGDALTFIRTGVGSALTGDAVLYLEKTPARRLVLFGSCGLLQGVPGLAAGDLVSPEKSLSLESFTSLLKDKIPSADWAFPSGGLYGNFMSVSGNKVKKTVAAAMGSLKLEEERAPFLKEKGVEVVDMESSAFFAAGKNIGRETLALFYIFDAVTSLPFYAQRSREEEQMIESRVLEGIALLEKNIPGHSL
ncbi:MAG TPA: hypothetical protein VJC03_09295 [bacterium]|nr:hypothetical protein [bacterium]